MPQDFGNEHISLEYQFSTICRCYFFLLEAPVETPTLPSKEQKQKEKENRGLFGLFRRIKKKPEKVLYFTLPQLSFNIVCKHCVRNRFYTLTRSVDAVFSLSRTRIECVVRFQCTLIKLCDMCFLLWSSSKGSLSECPGLVWSEKPAGGQHQHELPGYPLLQHPAHGQHHGQEKTGTHAPHGRLRKCPC